MRVLGCRVWAFRLRFGTCLVFMSEVLEGLWVLGLSSMFSWFVV